MRRTSKKTLLGTALAVTAAAAVGGLSTDARSGWYARLRKPSWQPPPQAFGLVWTPLYATIAYASARALSRGDDGSRPEGQPIARRKRSPSPASRSTGSLANTSRR
ncbi:TspO/MBR family protein [Microbispora sp. KK1-11]|uniref:TspO/MBR family protein n=1 Tax=Microbispora sp. KK1-11 TaxID=2053005 RepID=UPI00115AD9AF|nr:TspO/MBR family protein [Microbispora sp. KK1-11]TQS26539.1 tryptophan-rich sensory protein [Microbispora sp. KK1-11]